MLTLKEELLIGAFVFFAENGETIDAATVAIDSLPDDVPATNWTDWELGAVERVKITPTIKQFPQSKPRRNGRGYNSDPKQVITGWVIEMTLDSYSEFIHRLQLGSTAKVVDGVAFTPFQKGTDLHALGWMRIEAKADGITKVNVIDWTELRLTSIPEWKEEFGKPVLQFTVLGDDDGGLSTCVVNAA